MSIKRGDRLVHRKARLKCRALADEEAGLVLATIGPGVVNTLRAADLDQDPSDLPLKFTSTGEVVARRNVSGPGYRAVVKDKLTRTERQGAICPGDPDDFVYDDIADTWSAMP